MCWGTGREAEAVVVDGERVQRRGDQTGGGGAGGGGAGGEVVTEDRGRNGERHGDQVDGQ